MKRLLFLLIIASISIINSFSQIAGSDDAFQLARNFYAERLYNATGQTSFELSSDPITIFTSDNPAFYVFERKDQAGFIMISAEKSVYPVLGYSFESFFNEPSVPPVQADMIAEYRDAIEIARSLKIEPKQYVVEEWEYYLNPGFDKSTREITAQLPLLLTRWNQGCYYNELCPEDAAGPCGYVYAGCVATAMAQVMKYHNWPPQGVGSKIYTQAYGNYGPQSVNFGTTTYDWALMENNLSGSNLYVAELLYHCGVSVSMNYAPDGSGANTAESAQAYIDYFRYSNYLNHQEKQYFADENWEELIRLDLLSERPVLYRGYGGGGGHAFVCDGFQGTSQNHFHFDFGWSGASNGYYYLTSLNGFTSDQGAIFSVEPVYDGPQYCDDYILLTEPTGVISDGSDTNRYANMTSCKWLIQPENAGAIVLDVSSLKTETGFDRILVFEGESEADYKIADISGFNVPTNPIVVTGGSMFIWFFSDDINAGPGWEATYSTWMASVDEVTQLSMSVSPNPAQDVVSVQVDGSLSGNIICQIYDISGSKVFSNTYSLNNGNFTADVSSLPSGIYTMEILTETHGTVTEKLIISE